MIRRAHIDGENRFWLLRDWSQSHYCEWHGHRCCRCVRTLTYVMLNPSKADDVQDDPTIRKCVGFATRLGYERMYVVNLFSKRATNPIELQVGVGRRRTNLVAVQRRLLASDTVVFAWGASVMQAPPAPRARALRSLAGVVEQLDVRPLCLGATKDGHPRHPVRLSYTTQLEPWKGYNVPEWAFLNSLAS
jgi:hypothetical protein